jgi:hypothetical protein
VIRKPLILAFDKKKQLIAWMTALRPDAYAATQQSVIMDRNTRSQKRITKNAKGV